MRQKEHIKASLKDDGYAYEIIKPIKEEIDRYLGNPDYESDSYEFTYHSSILIYPSGLSSEKVEMIRKIFIDKYLK